MNLCTWFRRQNIRLKSACAISVFMIVSVVLISPFQAVIPSKISSADVQEWTLVSTEKRSPPSSTSREALQIFRQVEDKPTFVFSAVANYDRPYKGHLNIIINTMNGYDGELTCCVLLQDSKLYRTKARFTGAHHHENFLVSIREYLNPANFPVKQYNCLVPGTARAENVSLTSSTCSRDVIAYLPVIYPPKVPGGLAICAKTVFGRSLIPERLIDWIEMQKILGVDKILIYDLHCPEKIQKVFKYYQQQGILDVQPYELPGVVLGVPRRGFPMDLQLRPQFSHDEHLPVIDCRERLAGYSWVAGIDIDEIILPAEPITLKEFIKKHLHEHPDTGSIFFHVQFHVTSWGKYKDFSNIHFLEYLKSTRPRWECEKYIYLPDRVNWLETHKTYIKSPYISYTVPPEVGIIHHYRVCPHVWKNCFPEIIIDKSLIRYQDILQKNVENARKEIERTKPT